MEGYYAYLEGGYQIDGQEISAVSHDQLRVHARKIKELGIHAITIVGVYSPSYTKQEEDAAAFLAKELGSEFDISCSHSIGQAGFLERENAAILNASIRRFSRQIVHSLDRATRFLANAGLYITLNDGTLARASYAAANPLRCLSSGPTNSARGAAFLAQEMVTNNENGRDLLVIDVACVKVAGVKTNFSMPDVHSIALGAGSVIRNYGSEVSVGPDSVALEESTKALHAGGPVFTIGKISSTFDRFIIPGDRSVRDIVADGKRRAIAMCEEAGGDPSDVEIVELEAIPEPYAMDGTFRLVGSPSVFVERLPGGNETNEAMFATLDSAGISDFSHIVPTEIGGINALEALLSGALLDKPVLDADLMGRAFPHMFMTVLGAQGKKLTPASLSDGNGNIVQIKTARDDWHLENLARAACGAMKSIAGMCLAPLVGEESKLFVQNSYSVAWEIGRNMYLARQSKRNIAQAIVEPINGDILFSGKIHSVSRKVSESLTKGTCVIRSEGVSGLETDGDGEYLELIFTNEFSAAVLKTRDGDDYVERYMAASPDLICMLDGADGMPIGVTEVRYGLRVDIIAMPAPAVWYTEEGLKRAGPTVFGYVA
ncbi:putative hydantoinase oxoprolinase [Diaporthe ampelina]|uniref:Putative hydantoinase oxoprolinase n=1 Tax=Diaporthe ampelina TaxID=1214573 RepID=A0A0G2FAN0_9PEZI|nr:putative hydantoinase oxoprolinase [Diaporthe ampelina]